MTFSPRSPAKAAAVLVAAALLGACTAMTSLRDPNGVRAPQTVRNFSLGQPAEVYFAELTYMHSVEADLDAWRRTGLFSTVTRAQRDEPLKNGIFIRVQCTEGASSSGDGGFVTGVMWLLTLGIVPTGVRFDESSCKMAMYQNTLLVGETTASITYKTVGSSWLLIPDWFNKDKQKVIFQQDTAAIRVNNLLAAVSK